MSPKNEHTEGPLPTVTFRVFRYSADSPAEPRFDTYKLAVAPGTTVLSALFQIRRECDSTLAFRFSCRGAVCGNCAMTINGRCSLACRTQVASLPGPEVIIEPLPNLHVIRDLVVDMGPFWDKYRQIQPWLHAAVQAEEEKSDHRQSPADFARIESLANCILCACCYGACRVLRRQPEYLGPAILAKLARFEEDTRDHRPAAALAAVDDEEEGAWGCDMHHRCSDVCPKDAGPDAGIAALRRRLVRYRLGGRRETR
jgi:succinate dehydrogenase / fumarate reductase iron-sulfur subunit